MAKRYRMAVTEVEAVQVINTKEGIADVLRFYPGAQQVSGGGLIYVAVETPNCYTRAEYGDWIAKDVEGFFYPISAAVFAATYEEVPA